MAVKNLQSVVCNVASQRGNVTNLDSKGYDVAMYAPAISSPQYPWLSCEPMRPAAWRERGTFSPTVQATARFGALARWAGTTGNRGTFPAERFSAKGNQRFPRHIRTLVKFAAVMADRDDEAKTIRSESLAG